METEWKLEKLILRSVVVTPEDIKNHIHHFKNLSFLEISLNDNPKASSTFGEICIILQENVIFLKGVKPDHSEDPLLLSYLSYSGLTKLYLHMEDDQFEFQLESEIIDQVYSRVIPNHHSTLEQLKMGSQKVRVWGEIPNREQLVELGRWLFERFYGHTLRSSPGPPMLTHVIRTPRANLDGFFLDVLSFFTQDQIKKLIHSNP